MKFGLFVPNVGAFGDPGVLVEIARRADESGWDGFFLWDMLTPALAPADSPDVVDPWIVLAAVAASTTRIRLGPMVTPVARRSPAKLARETASLDRLSGGRLVFGAALGDCPDEEFASFGDNPDARVRAEQLDEGLEILDRLWSGETTTHAGRHFDVAGATFTPRPVQEPRIPVWIGGHWPGARPVRRAARWDGMFALGAQTLVPDDYRALTALVAAERGDLAGWDLVHASRPHDRPADRRIDATLLAPYEAVGVTWWLEMFWPVGGTAAVLERAARAPLR
jgi:alkanesulfonate monooxygenase SsuD/methylene tetrahydromethanopterin reductase-like flavin-dependent oxidoreductase (luciferase family)